MKTHEFIRAKPGRGNNEVLAIDILIWIIPAILMVLGVFGSTQLFAKLMNYDPIIVGAPLLKVGTYYIYNPGEYFAALLKFAFQDEFASYFAQSFPPVVLCLVTALTLFIILSIIKVSKQKGQDLYGTACWAVKKTLQKFGLLQEIGVVCGQLDDADLPYSVDPIKAALTLHCRRISQLICHSGRTNTIMIAPTRSGKGVGMIIPSLLNYGIPYKKTTWKNFIPTKEDISGGSVIVYDPKGENWQITAGFRSQFSVCIPFRPLDPENSFRINIILEIPVGPKAYMYADQISDIFFGNAKKNSGGDGASEYFNSMARELHTAVVLYVRFAKDIPLEKKNMSYVLSLFSLAKDETSEPQKKADDEEECGAELIKKLRAVDTGNEQINTIIVDIANRSAAQNNKERASTFATVVSKISLFQDPLIAASTATSDFSLDDFVESGIPISLYLIVPWNNAGRISPIFRLLISFMLKKFSDGETSARAVRLKCPLVFLLDEFPVLGYFPLIAEVMGVLAGFGVTFIIICQALNQLVDLYGQNHPFLDHCKTIILYAPGSHPDAEYFSKMIGQESVLYDQVSTSGRIFQFNNENVNRSSQEIGRNLINADELLKLSFNQSIVLNQGMPPYLAKKVCYYEDIRFKKLSWMDIPALPYLYEVARQNLPSGAGSALIRRIQTELDTTSASTTEQPTQSKGTTALDDAFFNIFTHAGDWAHE